MKIAGALTKRVPNKNNAELTKSPFIRYLQHGAGNDGYWNYDHMVVQIEDCIDCLKYLYPQFDFVFELDHSSGHAKERPDGLSTPIFDPNAPKYDITKASKERVNLNKKELAVLLKSKGFDDTGGIKTLQ